MGGSSSLLRTRPTLVWQVRGDVIGRVFRAGVASHPAYDETGGRFSLVYPKG